MPKTKPAIPGSSDSKTETCLFYRTIMKRLKKTGIPFLIGGSYAYRNYTGIIRNSKDLDIFAHPRDLGRILDVFSGEGYETEITSPHWLAKIFSGKDFVDIIFGSGKAIHDIDDEWFTNSVEDEVLGVQVRLCPPEETIWSKSYIMERDRFDGADIAHLILARAQNFDWNRLLRRFGAHWQLLLSYLILFCFIYPSERKRIPDWVMSDLLGRYAREMENPPMVEKLCRGTLLSTSEFLIDVESRGYEDAREQLLSLSAKK